MFALNDEFLQELGLDGLPEDQKQAFKDHIYSELELRVGVRLSEGLTDEQLAEFESFVDRDDSKVRAWLMVNVPNYPQDPAYIQLKSSAPQDTDENTILAEYVSLKWLGINRPDYRNVVSQVLEELKQEIISNKDTILGNDAV